MPKTGTIDVDIKVIDKGGAVTKMIGQEKFQLIVQEESDRCQKVIVERMRSAIYEEILNS